MRRYKPYRRLKPKRWRAKKLIKSKFFWFGVLAIFVLAGFAYGIFFTPLFRIKNIEIEGNEKISAEDLRGVAEANLPKRIFFFSINHFFLLDGEAVSGALERAFPEVESVAVKKRFPDGVLIRVQERQGIAVWCQQKTLQVALGDSKEETTRSFRQCFALDKQGVVFEEKEPEMEVIVSGDNTEAVLGSKVIEEDLLQSILQFQRAVDAFVLFQEVGLRISSLHLVSREQARARISEGWEIYFDPTGRIDWQLQKVKLVLEQEIPFQKRPFLEYIDLRFGDQAYIKYRQ